MDSPDQRDIDERIQTYYGEIFDETARLTTRSAQGPLEFRRTQELIRSFAPQGRVADIGGGSGVHARALLDAGYRVDLIDPVQSHVDAARAEGIDACTGDARDLPFEDATFDIALVLGPLYHLSTSDDRRQALVEAARITKPGGMLFAAALSRYVGFGNLMLSRPVPAQMREDWTSLIIDGVPSSTLRFPAGHFHTAEELHEEVASAGWEVRDVVGVEGPAGLFLEMAENADDDVREAALTIARAASRVPGIRDQSAHLMAVAIRPV